MVLKNQLREVKKKDYNPEDDIDEFDDEPEEEVRRQPVRKQIGRPRQREVEEVEEVDEPEEAEEVKEETVQAIPQLTKAEVIDVIIGNLNRAIQYLQLL